MEDGDRRVIRPRVILYPTILTIVLTMLVVGLATRNAAQVHILKLQNMGHQFVVNDNVVTNRLRIEISNRTDTEQTYTASIVGEPRITVRLSEDPMTVPAGEMAGCGLIIDADPAVFTRGKAEIEIRFTDGDRFDKTYPYKILGPYGTGATP